AADDADHGPARARGVDRDVAETSDAPSDKEVFGRTHAIADPHAASLGDVLCVVRAQGLGGEIVARAHVHTPCSGHSELSPLFSRHKHQRSLPRWPGAGCGPAGRPPRPASAVGAPRGTTANALGPSGAS